MSSNRQHERIPPLQFVSYGLHLVVCEFFLSEAMTYVWCNKHDSHNVLSCFPPSGSGQSGNTTVSICHQHCQALAVLSSDLIFGTLFFLYVWLLFTGPALVGCWSKTPVPPHPTATTLPSALSHKWQLKIISGPHQPPSRDLGLQVHLLTCCHAWQTQGAKRSSREEKSMKKVSLKKEGR